MHCYRMLGSLVDAEDLLQETLIAAWRGLDGFAGRSTLRAWLYRIATNRCLNAIRDTKRRRLAEPIPPFDPPPPSRRGDVTWLQPYPDVWLEQAADQAPDPEARYLARETVELAFIAALQRLPPRQASVVLLHDVLNFSTVEVAAMLDTSATAIKGVLQRARASLDHADAGTARGLTAAKDTAKERDLARRFAQAFTHDDIAGVVDLLTDDAWLAMPPAPHEYLGTDAIAAFLHTSMRWHAGRHMHLVPTRANAQPAFGCYITNPEMLTASPAGLLVLTVSEARISGITRFLDEDLPQLFGLAVPRRHCLDTSKK